MDKDARDFLVTAGSIALGAWVLKKLFEDRSYYKCPRCNYPVNQKQIICTNCGQPLRWLQ